LIIAARRKELLGFLKEQGSVNTKEASKRLGVSEMTIRRDLDWLYSNNFVTKVHGGAVYKDFMVSHVTVEYSDRKMENMDLKKQIAREAVKLVEDNCSIYLDGGTTCGEIAVVLPRNFTLTIITDNLAIHSMLQNVTNYTTILIGGTLAADHNTLDGLLALEMAKMLTCDIAFFSCASADTKGLMNTDTIGVPVKKEMVEKASCSVCVCDSSKLEKSSIYRTISWLGVDYFFTDTKANDSFLRKIKGFNQHLVYKKC
jgi:DeoR family transcriptional regulator of aga operon